MPPSRFARQNMGNWYRGCHPLDLAGQAPFAQKVARFQNCNDRFFALIGDYRELQLAGVDVEQAIRGVALREKNLVLAVICHRPSGTDFGEKIFRVEKPLRGLLGNGLTWHEDRSETIYDEGKEELQLDSISEAQQAKRLHAAFGNHSSI